MRIRQGGPDDAAAIMAMLDGAVAWLAENGRSGQWGTEPFSTLPQRVESIAERTRTDSIWIAEVDGSPAGAMATSPEPVPYVDAVDEPELYITLLVTGRAFAGRGVGAALLAHARDEARRRGAGLVRVDCYAGGEGRLVGYYRRNGFTPVETFSVGEWPGQVLSLRV
ncbi:MAG: GNAT family N-acetyltransferase [Actinoallomurus sp.]